MAESVSPFRISVAGHLCVDLTPTLGPTARFAPGQLIDVGPLGVRLGGAVANTGLALAGLGTDPELQAVVGDDALAGLVAGLLGDVRRRIAVVPGATTSYSVVLEPPGTDRTFWHHTGVNAHFDPALVSVDTDLLHIGYPSLLPAAVADHGAPLAGLFARARAAGATTSLDLADVDPDGPVGGLDWAGILTAVVAETDVVSPSVDDLRSALADDRPASLGLAREYAGWLLARGAGVAMVTAGAHGLALRVGSAQRLASGGRVLSALPPAWADADVLLPPAPVTDVVTSTGAGDAASAGLLAALVAGLQPAAAAEAARTTAITRMRGLAITPLAGAGGVR